MTDTAQTAKVRLRVEGMDCKSCATKIENALRRMPGISDVIVSLPSGTVILTHDTSEVDDKIRNQISDLGYRVTGGEEIGIKHPGHDRGERTAPKRDDDSHSHNHEEGASDQSWWQTRKGMLTIASGLALATAYLLGKSMPATEHWAFLLAMLVGLIPIGRRAISAARAGTPFSIEMLMSIAAVGAVFIGATEEAATVVFLFLIGELLAHSRWTCLHRDCCRWSSFCDHWLRVGFRDRHGTDLATDQLTLPSTTSHDPPPITPDRSSLIAFETALQALH